MAIQKNDVIGKVLDMHPELADVFTANGMHCLSCPCARAESIEEACAVHGIDVDELVEDLNIALGE